MTAQVLRLITEPEIDLNRQPLIDWLTASGVNVKDVVGRWLSVELEDGRRLVRYRAYRTTVDGRRLLDPESPERAWTEERTTLITSDPPLMIKGRDHHRE